MNLPREIESINDALKIGSAFSGGWFRGHNQVFNNLTPKAYREEYPQGFAAEFHLIQKFKLRAPLMIKSPPASNDYLSWLIYGQHFGLPTRLLDWTESILVALWFSVNSFPKTDAELWAMSPGSLNKYHKHELLYDDIALAENILVQYLAYQPMYREEIKYQEVLRKEYEEAYGPNFKFPKYPIAFMPAWTISRQVSQLSAFTIHPRPEDGKSITQILNDKNKLFRCIIRKENKDKLKKQISDLGITRRMLFLDLESLVSDIISESI